MKPWSLLRLFLGLLFTATGLAKLLFQVGYGALAAMTLRRGIALDNCGCFGVFLARPLRWTTVLEDAALAAISALCLWRSPPGRAAPRRT